jgi:hypothetical protein
MPKASQVHHPSITMLVVPTTKEANRRDGKTRAEDEEADADPAPPTKQMIRPNKRYAGPEWMTHLPRSRAKSKDSGNVN